jgi:hypothetical protein
VLATSNTPGPLVAYRTQFQYDSLDRVTTLIYPDNDQVGYEYNDRGLMARIVGGPSGSILSNLVYAPSAQQQQIDYGNGIRTSYEYDKRQRLASLLTFQAANSTNQLINFRYTFDGVSNIRNIQDLRDTSAIAASDNRRNTQVFTYDDLYRLTRVQYNQPNLASVNGGEVDYRYDRIGNMLAQTSDITQLENGLPVANLGAMVYGGNLGSSNRTGRQATDPAGPHALSQISNFQSSVTNRVYGYDANGNMTNIDGLQCTWDFKDRLVAVENDTVRAEYRYDYTDRRIVKKVLWKQGEPPAQSSTLTQQAQTIKSLEAMSSKPPGKGVDYGELRPASSAQNR